MKFIMTGSIENPDSSLEEMQNEILLNFGKSEPGPGCSFIDPSGMFIQIYPKFADHEDLATWLIDIGFDDTVVVKDAEWFVETFNYIKCRNSSFLSHIMCPSHITKDQYYSLEKWLETQIRPGIKLQVICGKEIRTYNTDEYFSEDIIKIIKRYYSCGTLYESGDKNGC